MLLIPLRPVPSQTVMVTLADQLTQINVYQKAYGLFMDVLVGNVLILGGAILQDRNLVVRSAYLGFTGDFVSIDTQGTADPTYEGLGTRYRLAYIEANELTG